MMYDIVEKIGNNTLIQHGKLNDRIYLMKLHNNDQHDIINDLETLADRKGYSKIFCKIPAAYAPSFLAKGFITEAIIPKFYNFEEDAFFISKFTHKDRLAGLEKEKLLEFSKLLRTHTVAKSNYQLDSHFSYRLLKPEDASDIANIYKAVFKSYPFPIHEADYIEKTMKENIFYFGITHNQQLVAVSSAETDSGSGSCEMTDFATLPEYRGKKLAQILLNIMEDYILKKNYKTVYTIARLHSIPMNKTFFNAGYKYAGSLLMNTNIGGKIETMNVLYKHL